jgi:hypothetical protein
MIRGDAAFSGTRQTGRLLISGSFDFVGSGGEVPTAVDR